MSLTLADMVWPALYLVDRMVAVPVIIVGLLLEAALFRRVFRLSWRRAGGVACAANAISALVGVAVLPTWGWYWESSVATRNHSFGWGTFNPLTWAETCLMAWLLTSLVEYLPLRGYIGRHQNLLPTVLLANALSVGIAYLSLSFLPSRHDPWRFYDWASVILPAAPYIIP